MLMEQRDSGKLFAAICASPKIVFDDNKLIDGYYGTSHPT